MPLDQTANFVREAVTSSVAAGDSSIDPANASTITYAITDRAGGGTSHISLTDSDSEVDVVQAQDVISSSASKPADLSDVSDTQTVVRVQLAPSDTDGLPEGPLWQECQLEGIRGGTDTVVGPERIRVESSAT